MSADFGSAFSLGVLAAILVIGAVISCTEARVGHERGDCYPNKTCNAGLVCASDVCVKLDGGAE